MPSAQVSPELHAHTVAMTQYLQAQISSAGGWLPFDRYMQAVLYAPELGYYRNGLKKFGEGGDFITAPEIGQAFGGCIARQCAQVLGGCGGSIIEFGAGSGALMVTIMLALKQEQTLPERYYIVELSAELRDRQQQLAQQQLGEDANRLCWLNRLPDKPINGVIVANEVLDAMPVKLFSIEEQERVEELGVQLNGEGELIISQQSMSPPISETIAQRVGLMSGQRPYRSEIGLQGEAWVASLSEAIDTGAVLLIDYGFNQATYYHPDRSEGTLMCHFQHHSNDDPLYMPGLQDVTSHVNFTALADSAQDNGFEVAGFAPQAHFLLALGLLENVADGLDDKSQMKAAQEIKKLTLPHEMGELFKVLALTKNFDEPLLGFTHINHGNRLWT
jgi:SAM-dependent MidA family methyltransferase